MAFKKETFSFLDLTYEAVLDVPGENELQYLDR